MTGAMISHKPTNQNSRPITVLIVDDDSAVRTALSRLIRAAGLRCVAYAGIDELLEQVGNPINTCIVADIRFPGTSGLALPARLAERGLKLPVIFVTAQDNEAMRAEAKKVGAAGYFRKPVDDHALLDTIEWVLRDNGHAVTHDTER